MKLVKIGRVLSVSLSPRHGFSKAVVGSIRLLAGLGVEGDAHCGALVQHRYHVKKDPTQPNRTQVHLIQAELFEELAAKRIEIKPGDMGENITTGEIDLLSLPAATLLHVGGSAVVEVTGLRDPCVQMNKLRPGLMRAVIEKRVDGTVMLKAGIMGVVRTGGIVLAGDPIRIELPRQPWQALTLI